MRRWLWVNSLSLVLFTGFLVFLVLQSVFGWQTTNAELADHARPTVGYLSYLGSGAFAEATFENWESEFLQMGFYVLLTAWLVQRGSAESHPPDEPRDDDPPPGHGTPALARRGGVLGWLYAHSLATALLGIFALSFLGHLLGGTAAHNAEQALNGQPPIGVTEFARSPEFWFQSMQNWQSEFLAVGVLVVASIWLRQHRSPQSKKVTAPHSQTGTD
ncbi:DUF6766 family protein [Longispora urticae]